MILALNWKSGYENMQVTLFAQSWDGGARSGMVIFRHGPKLST